jgi:hypothetical protein
VSCVAEQEYLPVAPPVGELGVEGVLGRPHDLQLVEANVSRPRRDQGMQPVDLAIVSRCVAGQ